MYQRIADDTTAIMQQRLSPPPHMVVKIRDSSPWGPGEVSLTYKVMKNLLSVQLFLLLIDFLRMTPTGLKAYTCEVFDQLPLQTPKSKLL